VLIALDCICISEELAKPEGIPNFWLTVFKNSPIGPLVEEHDEPILKHLTDLSYEILPDNTGYRLIFKFSANEYFTNTELIKTVLVDDMFGDEEITETSATKIEWNAGKDVTFELKAQPAPRRGRGRGRGGRGGAGKPKKVPVPSFFHFFDALPSLEDNDDIDEEDFMAIAEEQERDQQLVGLIKDSIISRAAVYFTGEEKGMLASVGKCHWELLSDICYWCVAVCRCAVTLCGTLDEEDDDELDYAGMGGDDDSDEDDMPVRAPARRRKQKKSTVEEIDSDDNSSSGAPALSFPSFSAGAAPAFNFSFGSGAGTTLGGAPSSGKQFNFTPSKPADPK
jgi:hypothetical protein